MPLRSSLRPASSTLAGRRTAPRRLNWARIPVLSILLLGFAVPAASQDADRYYKVEGVEVSAEGNTGAQAKDRAIATGRRTAFNRLMARITLPKDRARLPRPDAQSLRDLVAGFVVENETARAKSYKGRITFRFDKAKIEDLLQTVDVGFVQTGGRPVLMLPVWQEGATPLLWDDPNPWRQAWRKVDPKAGSVTFAQPRGDLEDLQAISGQQALQLDRQALSAIAKRYNAAVVLISHARREGNGVKVRVMRFDVDRDAVTTVGTYDSNRSDAGMTATAKKIAAAFVATWKTTNVVPTGPAEKMTVVAPLSGLAYWIRLRDSMAKARGVRSMRILRLSPAEAEIELTYVGTRTQLTEALREAGIQLGEGTPRENGDPGPSVVRMAGGQSGGQSGGTNGTDRAPGTGDRSATSPPRPRTQ